MAGGATQRVIWAAGVLGPAVAACAQAGAVIGWGFNGCGQANPQMGSFIAAAGNNCATTTIRDDGTLLQWGDIWSPAPAGTFTAVVGSRDIFLGLRTDGTLAFWGFAETPIYNVPSGTFRAVSTVVAPSLSMCRRKCPAAGSMRTRRVW